MINRGKPKSESEIDALIKGQLRQAGFNEKGKPMEEEIPQPKLDQSQQKPQLVEQKQVKQKVIDDRYIRLEELPSNFKPYP